MAYETIVYRRDELYAQVWAEPVRTVAKRYGVSDVALAKMCKKLSVPVPGRGYWAEKEAGKSPVRPTMATLPAGAQTEIRVSRRRPDGGPLVDAEIITRVEQEKSSTPISVTSVLSNPHPLVARAAKLLGKAKPEDGLVSVHGQSCLNVLVSPALLDRTLRILDALIKGLIERDIQIEVAAIQVKDERHYGRADPLPAGFGHRDHRNRCMAIAWFGHGDRSEATLVGST